MRRQTFDGGWFDRDAAKSWEEDTRWNGNNHVSVATGSQWDHETLYLTRRGRWVLHHTSQWQGSTDRWTEIGAAEAAAWLVANDHEAAAEKHLGDAVAAQEG